MQAGLCWNAKTVEFVRLNDDHRVAATHHYSLRLTCGCETDDLAEPCFGFLDRPYGAFDRILEEESGWRQAACVLVQPVRQAVAVRASMDWQRDGGIGGPSFSSGHVSGNPVAQAPAWEYK